MACVLGKRFEAVFRAWDQLIGEASEFATTLPSEKLISISHSVTGSRAVVIVWYWSDPDASSKWGHVLAGDARDVCPECGQAVG